MGEAAFSAASEYLSLGFSVIPICDGEKRPAVKWIEYQSRYATKDELERWFLQTDINNLAIVTGRISNLTVIDVDPRNGGESSLLGLPPLGQATVKTGGGGWHYYYQWRGDDCKPGILKGIDLKGDGGYVLAPPSETNERYTFCSPSGPVRREWDDQLISQLFKPQDAGFIEQRQGPAVQSHMVPFQKLLLHRVPPGSRNNAAAKLFGKLLYSGVPSAKARMILKMWNSDLPVPLSLEELDQVMDSIEARHIRRNKT